MVVGLFEEANVFQWHVRGGLCVSRKSLNSSLLALNFLLPSPLQNPQHNSIHDCHVKQRRLSSKLQMRLKKNELIWWPPKPVLELARLAIESGGDPGSMHRALDYIILPLPDVEGWKEHKCEFTRTPYGRRRNIDDTDFSLAVIYLNVGDTALRLVNP
ncbi:hypothetical protein SADUNF_Sadunf05G0014500 [Salix dunnii]|uniref:Uncharacterized protein n=1 Tax=Salix dunnii TaxID=1413687 RepID=A0A835N1I9_9ROSI|nr:hypothetical protein SADUNF_Sadunf05G0014500 [Salix dunnii]